MGAPRAYEYTHLCTFNRRQNYQKLLVDLLTQQKQRFMTFFNQKKIRIPNIKQNKMWVYYINILTA